MTPSSRLARAGATSWLRAPEWRPSAKLPQAERHSPPLLASECDPGQRKALLQALRERGADLSATDPLGNNVESLARGEIRTR
ncbi:MAG: hypothetical protein KJ881_16660 [Gammaproteobacteria bacterium]|nr:hypothetical protein [Gammaproteobacteria bacterium]